MTYYYALCLAHCHFLMVNSSWTRDHIASIISHENSGFTIRLAHCLTPLFLLKLLLSEKIFRVVTPCRESPSTLRPPSSGIQPIVVYPPCDMRIITKFDLAGREPIILSVAQFRCATSLI